MNPIASISLFTAAALAVLGTGLGLGAAFAPPSQSQSGRTGGKETPVRTMTTDDGRVISAAGYDVTHLSPEAIAELAKKLTPEQYRITQNAGTERPFCGTLLDNKKDGMYVCVVCGLPLFKSEHKFTSGTGWPSFFTGFDPAHVAEKTDTSHGMVRTEINCARCDAHLGHVFPDGPPPTNLRYCLNSESLEFIEKGAPVPKESQPVMTTENAYFAGGCFWGVEHGFQMIPGVITVESGYQQGTVDNPTYKQVCTGETGHAESVKVVFDPAKVSFETLVRFFMALHDPTQLNRQGPDFGTQYRSGIYTVGDEQLATAKKVIAELSASPAFTGRTIVTEVEPAKQFYAAEDYHQDYVEKTGRACHVNIHGAFKAAGLEEPSGKPAPH
jgi:peptide methionine sulfoxide reductase msrA/msrB